MSSHESHDNSYTIWGKPDSWRLQGQRITRPDGVEVERAFMDHPGSVVMVPLLGDEIVMIRQYRWALDQTILELPAGTRAWGEDIALCAQRELREETGYRAARLTPLGEIWPAPGFTNEILYFFLAEDLTHDPLPGDFDEHITLAPLSISTLETMLATHAVQDGKSIIGLQRALAWLARS